MGGTAIKAMHAKFRGPKVNVFGKYSVKVLIYS
jgi:hypothetical protein